jgi:hypothetical protein
MSRGRMLTKMLPGISTAVVRPFSADCALKGRSPKRPRSPQTTTPLSQRIISRPPIPARRARNSTCRRKWRLSETKKLKRTLCQACFRGTVSKTRGSIDMPCVAPSITEHLHCLIWIHNSASFYSCLALYIQISRSHHGISFRGFQNSPLHVFQVSYIQLSRST